MVNEVAYNHVGRRSPNEQALGQKGFVTNKNIAPPLMWLHNKNMSHAQEKRPFNLCGGSESSPSSSGFSSHDCNSFLFEIGERF